MFQTIADYAPQAVCRYFFVTKKQARNRQKYKAFFVLFSVFLSVSEDINLELYISSIIKRFLQFSDAFLFLSGRLYVYLLRACLKVFAATS